MSRAPGAAVFRGYDRAALDREYDNRRKVANAGDVLAWYAAESRKARRDLAARLDVAYGPRPGERLDVFPTGGASPAPVHVFIHGGYWQRLDKADFSYLARVFVASGVALVVVNYALIPTVDMDELVRQCRAAVAWVYRNAPSFGGDPARLTVSGHSAGGHLTAMVMATDWASFAGLPADVVKFGCGISGLYDLEPIRLCYLNEVLGLTAEMERRHSPVRLDPPGAGRLLLAVGGLEGAEYHRQTEDLAAAWRGRGFPVAVMDLAGHDHFSIVAQLADAGGELTRVLLARAAC